MYEMGDLWRNSRNNLGALHVCIQKVETSLWGWSLKSKENSYKPKGERASRRTSRFCSCLYMLQTGQDRFGAGKLFGEFCNPFVILKQLAWLLEHHPIQTVSRKKFRPQTNLGSEAGLQGSNYCCMSFAQAMDGLSAVNV